jgi:hypothetical protein
LPQTHAYSPMDRAIARLRAGLSINNDTRTYLISIGFMAPSPEEAEITNWTAAYWEVRTISEGVTLLRRPNPRTVLLEAEAALPKLAWFADQLS